MRVGIVEAGREAGKPVIAYAKIEGKVPEKIVLPYRKGPKVEPGQIVEIESVITDTNPYHARRGAYIVKVRPVELAELRDAGKLESAFYSNFEIYMGSMPTCLKSILWHSTVKTRDLFSHLWVHGTTEPKITELLKSPVPVRPRLRWFSDAPIGTTRFLPNRGGDVKLTESGWVSVEGSGFTHSEPGSEPTYSEKQLAELNREKDTWIQLRQLHRKLCANTPIWKFWQELDEGIKAKISRTTIFDQNAFKSEDPYLFFEELFYPGNLSWDEKVWGKALVGSPSCPTNALKA